MGPEMMDAFVTFVSLALVDGLEAIDIKVPVEVLGPLLASAIANAIRSGCFPIKMTATQGHVLLKA
jgi:hypothetical protein